jgi:hypothetical protein
MKKFHIKVFYVMVLAATFLAGCRSYEEKLIDWEKEAQAGKTNVIYITKLEDASNLALIGNRELNMMRLKAGGSAKIAKESGWWDDPELDFDLMRIVNPSSHPFLGGGSIAFTIPLSGALKLDKKAAEAYAEADAADIRSAESDVAAEARKAAIRLCALRRRGKMLVDWRHDERAERARRNVKRLHEAGEVSASELAGLRRKMHTLRHEIMENAKETTAAEIDFLRLLGLRPGCRIELKIAEENNVAKPSKDDDPLELVKHPKVVAALVRLGGTEHALKAEIRRQYPDLKLGPAYVNEEGLDRFGIVAGLSIPLWNRNRKGIADAEAARDEARLEAIDTWRKLVCDGAEARANLTELLAHPPVPSSEREHTDALADAGELTPMEYLAVRDEIMEFELADVEWRRDVALAVAELERLKVNH